MQSPFVRYVRHGWRLIPLDVGDKAPRQRGWNREELTLSEPEDVKGVRSAGLAHAYSGTCAIDIDDIKASQQYLKQFDIDLKAMYLASNSVRILSGRKNRAKLLYRIKEPLQSIKIIELVDGIKTNIIDFRCATSTGLTVQDALPPSIHPKTKKPYHWSYGESMTGTWKELPELPDDVMLFWLSKIHERDTEKVNNDGIYEPEEIADLLKGLDPDTDYEQWLKIGMAVHSASSGSRSGIEIWDEWSAKGTKYKGKKDLVPHWRSFRGSGISVDYLLMHQVAQVDVFDNIVGVSEKAKKVKKFTPTRVDKWVKRPPPKWIIHEVLPQSDLAMLFGQPGSGKSFFAMDMAMAIAGGHRWRDRDTVSGPVLWIAAEAAGSVRNRALAYAQHNRVNLSRADFWIIADTPDLNSVADVKGIAGAAKMIEPVVIVIDTMVAASGGANENSGQDMAIILAACRALHKITNALILLIHHSGKDQSKGARGWSGIKGAMQTEMEVSHEPTGERVTKIVKQRDGEVDLEFSFRLAPVTLTDFDGVAQSSCAVEAQDGVYIVESYLEYQWLTGAAMEIATTQRESIGSDQLLEQSKQRALKQDDAGVDENCPMLLESMAQVGYFMEAGKKIQMLGANGKFDEEF